MKISYNWLKDLVDIRMDPSDLAEELSLIGFEVDSVDKKSLDYPNVVTGKVLTKIKHPNADKLSVCTVDVGDEVLHIVCGAPNVATGQIVPVAKVGAVLSEGFKIKKAKIRGEISQGMICSEMELGLAEKSDGIWVLSPAISIGEPLAKALAFETDYIFDIGITPNRPDALSHIGIAREAAAIAGSKIRLPKLQVKEMPPTTASTIKVVIDCPETCPRYSARLIRNIKLGPSPLWLARRLEAVGMRPINNIVDITNYIMLETGQPLHAFDYNLVEEGKIIVRESKPGDKFITLDGKTHQLPAGTVMICDAVKPVAIGGIMGGVNSEVNDHTEHILLESAYFLPLSIRRSLRHLGMSTEASQRYERGTDPNGVIYARERAAQLIAEIAGGEIVAEAADNYPVPIHPQKVEIKTSQINQLLGIDLDYQKMVDLLQKIDLPVEDGYVIPPTFRTDITQTADLAEEVGRLFGYDQIPVSANNIFPYNCQSNPFDDFVDNLKDVLSGTGLQEVFTNSMVNKKTWERLTNEAIYPLLNPISNDMDGMRNWLMPSLLEVVQWNLNRQLKSISLFEINTGFFHPGDTKQAPKEEKHLAIVMTGDPKSERWYTKRGQYDFYDIKGIVEYLAAKFSLDNLSLIPYDNFAVEIQAAKIYAGKTELGYLGKIRSSLLKNFDIENPVFGAEINIQKLFDLTRKETKFQSFSKNPWVERDLAVVIRDTEEVGNLIKAIRNSGGSYLQKIFIFDTYSGKQIEAGYKSIAFRLIFQSDQKTMTEDEVTESTDNILKSLNDLFNATLRS